MGTISTLKIEIMDKTILQIMQLIVSFPVKAFKLLFKVQVGKRRRRISNE
jgi:hypothetical protein